MKKKVVYYRSFNTQTKGKVKTTEERSLEALKYLKEKVQGYADLTEDANVEVDFAKGSNFVLKKVVIWIDEIARQKGLEV